MSDAAVLAHAIGGRTDLPVPIEYFVFGAVIVLLVSFGVLALLWTEPRLQDGPAYDGPGGLRPPRVILGSLGMLGLALVIGQLLVPLLDLETDPTRPTIAPVLVWVCFWLLIPFGSALVGNWYADLNPWRTTAWALRIGRTEKAEVLGRFGVWPASMVFVAFTWFELIGRSSGSAPALGLVALAYTVLLLLAMMTMGRESALGSLDMFTPYNRLISSISPLGRRSDGRIVWRGWLRSLTVVPQWKGLWVFVVVMIGTVTYDGASSAEWFVTLAGDLLSSQAGETILLLATIALIGLAYYGASAAAAKLAGSESSTGAVAQRFAHTLVPIALAYAFAHYFTLILFEGQQLIAAVSDPFGLGWDLFGTAERRTSFFVTTSAPIWYIQVGSIVGGHVLGVVLAHDRALADFGSKATRSQYAMLALMIALTSLGLLVLAG